jgi:hypothetical protein
MEIWVEALGGNADKFDRYVAMEIRSILAKMPEWKNQGSKKLLIQPYGRQRYFRRTDG